ncbi:hypothetical protein ACU4GI_21190 [Cupriavidus basilensis]
MFKLARYFGGRWKNIRLTHIGWERCVGERNENNLEDIEIHKEIILAGGGYGGHKVKALYPLWMILVFFRCLRMRKTDLVWALGFESAFPAYLASRIRGFEVIFDDADRFSMLFQFPRLLGRFVESLEVLTSRGVGVHVIPGVERYRFSSKKFHVVRNFPSASEIQKAREIYDFREWPKAKLVLNVNGWLGGGRGMDAVLFLAHAMRDENFMIILAGKIDCAAAEELSRLSNVNYLGTVSNAEALASYYASDFVFTYYDPSSEINRLAESNKWGDALKIGIGVVVNAEVETAEYLRTAGIAISVPYERADDLVSIFKSMLNSPDVVRDFKESAKQLSSEFGYYEDQLSLLFGKVGLR